MGFSHFGDVVHIALDLANHDITGPPFLEFDDSPATEGSCARKSEQQSRLNKRMVAGLYRGLGSCSRHDLLAALDRHAFDPRVQFVTSEGHSPSSYGTPARI